MMVLEQEEEDSYIEGKVNLEEELINALSELKRIRERYARVKGSLAELKKKNLTSSGIHDEAKHIITLQKLQIEEAKKIEETLMTQLREKEDICQARDAEIVSLRKKY